MSATEAAALAFYEAVRATGKTTASELHRSSGINPKAIRADLKSGRLKGEKAVIGGKPVWLIDPKEAADYAVWRRREISRAQRENIGYAQRGRRNPPGYLKPRQIAERWQVSETRLRAAIAQGSLKAVVKGSAIFVHNRTWTAFYRKHTDELQKRPIGKCSKKAV